MILRNILLAIILFFSASLSFADTITPSAVDTKTQQLLQLGSTFATTGVDGIKTAAESYVTSELNNEAVGVTKSLDRKAHV